jgi:hypothetical protein
MNIENILIDRIGQVGKSCIPAEAVMIRWLLISYVSSG